MFKITKIENYSIRHHYCIDYCTDYHFETDETLTIDDVICKTIQAGYEVCGEISLKGNILKTVMSD